MDNQQEVVQVSDWSQKYKLAIYVVSGMVIAVIGWKLVSILIEIRDLLHIIASK